MSESTHAKGALAWRFLTPQLPVRNVRETQRYYEDVFGCRIAWIYEEEYGAVYHGPTELYFSQTDEVFTPSWLFVRVGDADALLASLRTRGATIVEEIATKPWGMREFTAEDNNGHRLRFGHSAGSIVPPEARGSSE